MASMINLSSEKEDVQVEKSRINGDAEILQEIEHKLAPDGEASERYYKLADAYRESIEDPNSTELEVAINKLHMMQAERNWMLARSFGEDSEPESVEENDWDTYNRLLREEGRSIWELDALQTIKVHDPKYYEKMDGDLREVELKYLIERVQASIKELESKYPEFWQETHISP